MDTISNFLCVEKMGWSDAYTPNKDVVKRIEKEIAASGRDDRYIVIFGDENVNAQQAKLESEQRINAIKQVLANETNSPGPTSTDPAPTPKPTPTRRYRP